MTKQLQELFNVDALAEDNDAKRVFQDLEEIDQSIGAVTDLSASDAELDDLAGRATRAFEDLMDLGMNVEPRFSAPIFDSASKLLGHAITAKTNKIEKKLRAIDLKLKQRRVEILENKADPESGAITGQATILDRNELIRIIREGSGKIPGS